MPSSHTSISPLRYPGGKGKISNFLGDLILLNNLDGCCLYELYAGGAGASLNLLFEGICKNIVLNDLDFHIYAFWISILNDTDKFLKKINDTKISISEWEYNKNIYIDYLNYDITDVGFSTFFLNRSNRSGILYKAGPIGGKNQNGNYKIDVRFNKDKLIEKITKIADFKNKITILNQESLQLIEVIFNKKNEKQFVFLDPPYYKQGAYLYLNYYKESDHENLKEKLSVYKDNNWILTYDNNTKINQLYENFRRTYLPMTYTLQEKRQDKEVMIFSEKLFLPKQIRYSSQTKKIKLIG